MPRDRGFRLELDGHPLGIAVDPQHFRDDEYGAPVEIEFFLDGELCVLGDPDRPTDACTSLTFSQVVELRDHLNVIIRNSNGTRRTAPLTRRTGQVIASLEAEVALLRRARQTADAMHGIVEHQHAILDVVLARIERDYTEGHVFVTHPVPANGGASAAPGVREALNILRRWQTKPESIHVRNGNVHLVS